MHTEEDELVSSSQKLSGEETNYQMQHIKEKLGTMVTKDNLRVEIGFVLKEI